MYEATPANWPRRVAVWCRIVRADSKGRLPVRSRNWEPWNLSDKTSLGICRSCECKKWDIRNLVAASVVKRQESQPAD